MIPESYRGTINRQKGTLLETEVHSTLEINPADYLAQIEKAERSFRFSQKLYDNGLKHLVIVDYRLPLISALTVSKISFRVNPEQLHDLPSVTHSLKIEVVQMQFGSKYRGKKSSEAVISRHEQPSVVTEGLFAYLYYGDEIFSRCRCLDFPGSRDGDLIPRICPETCLDEIKIVLSSAKDCAHPCYGAVSRNRYHV